MKKLVLVLAVTAAPAAALLACATDNGSNVYGDTFGPPPERPDGQADGQAPGADGAPPPADGGGGADADATSPACTSGTIAVLAGDDASLSGAIKDKDGAWTGAAIAGAAAKSRPAIVPFGAGFLGVTRGPADALQSITYSAGFAKAAIGTATTIDAPSLAVVGATGHVVYYVAAGNAFFHGTNTGAGWDGATDPVQPNGGSQAIGVTPASIAPANGGALAFAQDGYDNDGLYVQSFSGGAWAAGMAVNGAGTYHEKVPPALVPNDGAFDLVLLFADNSVNHVIRYTTHPKASAVNTGWSSVKNTSDTAFTVEPFSAARVTASTIVVTFRGTDLKGYAVTGTIGANDVTWSAPAPLVAGGVAVDGPPAVAKGVCGDDAIAVYASGGAVKAVRLRGGAWSSPETVAGASGTRVAVATR